MTIKPILFNTEMVRALLDGRKSVTRRVVKPQPIMYGFLETHWNWEGIKPPYRPGDILYVRETWGKAFGVYWYRADEDNPSEPGQIPGMIERTKWHPSIHMPKEAARLFLRVKGVRVERLQEITEAQAEAEGCPGEFSREFPNLKEWTSKGTFAELWDNTIKKADLPRYGWEANPYVWCVSFERISKEEAYKDAH